ncbi:hypothetical protein BOH78_1606 [Pichia kudriavzevii]|uniref:Uncharacterized protein n=1 Tax=Pichia kudriavzevii TaxID=4909 RepID=A0A1V2LR20_PICKU|nr:hypothetical protein BOH78_1606 [Pichia kudriavzevii]
MPENSCPESDQNRWLRIPIADIGTGGNPRNCLAVKLNATIANE